MGHLAHSGLIVRRRIGHAITMSDSLKERVRAKLLRQLDEAGFAKQLAERIYAAVL